MARACWREGNRVRLLENGEAFFPAALAAIAAAEREVLLETFILFEDAVGVALQRALVDAGRRGVRVHVMVDGYGSPGFSAGFLAAMLDAGVTLRVFDPHPGVLGLRVNLFRRMHRKLLVVDGVRAFVGGINFSADHLAGSGPAAKQDYAVEVEGPVVADILSFVRAAMASDGTGEHWRHPAGAGRAQVGTAIALFLPRDNGRRADAIEDEYRHAIAAARREIVIANAYFFPGFGFLHALRQAARRGVRVVLVLQGEPDTRIARTAAQLLYRRLLDDGIRVFEYRRRPFHGKVAVIDRRWATVGSSNLDPLSLALNLEANLFVRDGGFAAQLHARLLALMEAHCREVDGDMAPRTLGAALLRPVAFHCLRHFPDWAGLLPAHTPRVAQVRDAARGRFDRAA